jgi:hypothetical protein
LGFGVWGRGLGFGAYSFQSVRHKRDSARVTPWLTLSNILFRFFEVTQMRDHSCGMILMVCDLRFEV